MLCQALEQGIFTRPEAREAAEQALEIFKQCLAEREQAHHGEAYALLVRASALWTRATWKQFLEEQVIGAAQPDAYRPLNDAGEA